MCAVIPLESLRDIKYGQVICYPKYSKEEHEKRIGEMEKLGIKSICFTGNKTAANFSILGKGCTSIVVLAILKGGKKAALKISRVDSELGRIHHEARMLQIANSTGIGPKLLGYTDRLLLMEYVEGELIMDWIKGLSGEEAAPRLKGVLKDILEQCWKLDSIGLDHGELSRADKHIIVDWNDKAHIIDFETASDRRRPANVTSISQYFFIRSAAASVISQKIRTANVEALIYALRRYKVEQTRESFENILNTLHLTN